MGSFDYEVAHANGETTLDITTATVIKAAQGTLVSIEVIVAGSAAGAAYDHDQTSGVSATNQIAAIPTTIGLIPLAWTCSVGIVVVPGTGQTLAVKWA